MIGTKNLNKPLHAAGARGASGALPLCFLHMTFFGADAREMRSGIMIMYACCVCYICNAL